MTITDSIRNRGVLGTGLFAIRHAHFLMHRYLDAKIDRRLGVETTERVPLSELRTSSAAWDDASPYQAITESYFKRMMAVAPFPPQGAAFVDLGAGKGRALIFAAKHPFAEILGVELSDELNRIGLRNIARMRARLVPSARIELRCMDARETRFPARDMYLFLNNPFGPSIMQGVLDNLERWYRASDRRLAVLYRNPSCAQLFERSSFLQPVTIRHDFHVYVGRGPSQTP